MPEFNRGIGMGPFKPEGGGFDSDMRPGTSSRSVTLNRFRRNALFYQRYWTKFFSVTQPDLARVATLIRSKGEALTLTTLVRAVISTRLRSGPQLTGDASVHVRGDTPSIRFWDPKEKWQIGDRALFAVPGAASRRTPVPRFGTVIRVEGEAVTALVDGLTQPQTYPTKEATDQESGRISAQEVDALFEREAEAQQIDYVIWRFGDRLFEQVLAALSADDRFLDLQARWYLRALAQPLTETQVVNLARGLFAQTSEPTSFDVLIPLVDPPLSEGPAGRFGLLRALSSHPALFRRVEAKPEPLWALAGPPPGRWVARHAAYDPETFEVLCEPWEVIGSEAAQRLWACHLFRAVVTGAPSLDADL